MPDIEALCPGCFLERGTAAECPHCGYHAGLARNPLVLPLGTLLDERYAIGHVLGKPGGFGITYLALDLRLHKRVAVKEYLPRDLAGRHTDGRSVVLYSRDESDLFSYGKARFLQEAQALAQFDHANIVRVLNFFESNGTAYLVMEYYEGKTLDQYLKEQPEGRIAERLAVEIMLRLLDGLREVHGRGYLHRDIKPSNVYLTREGRPVLIDFGAARMAMGERSRSLSVVMTPGYAPYEQYHRRGRQGPWTDVYGCGATLYRMLTGRVPQDAAERIVEDRLEPPDQSVGGLSSSVSAAVMRSLAVRVEDRLETAEAFQALLSAAVVVEEERERAMVGGGVGEREAGRWNAGVSTGERTVGGGGDEVFSGGWAGQGRIHERRWWLLGALVVSLILIGYGSWVANREAEQRREAEALAEQQRRREAELAEQRRRQAEALAEQQRRREAELAEQRRIAQSTGKTFTNSLGMAFIRIPAGTFQMGDIQGGGGIDQSPVHTVTLTKDFYMGKYEVTQRQWEAVMGRNPSYFDECGGDCPVEEVSWDNVQAFIEALNVREGTTAYRLPTEAEWEYAARAGTTTKYSFGNDESQLGDYAWYRSNSGGTTHPVGQKRPNAWGLYDMHGNVWEWVQDWYSSTYYSSSPSVDPAGPGSGAARVKRGGSWGGNAFSLRSASRSRSSLGARNSLLGFRLVRSAE